MLLIITLLIIFIICIIGYFLDSRCLHTDLIEIFSIIIGIIFGVAFLMAITVALISQCCASYDQAKLVIEYNTLQDKVEHIDEYNACEVKEEVTKWNNKLLTEYYAQQSPWISVYHTYKLDDVDYLKVE